jgi:hypothetical protein
LLRRAARRLLPGNHRGADIDAGQVHRGNPKTYKQHGWPWGQGRLLFKSPPTSVLYQWERLYLVISEHLKRIINTYGAAILLELSTNPSMFSCNNGPSGYSLATEALAILGLRKELLKGIA